jgi:hypothetical protein
MLTPKIPIKFYPPPRLTISFTLKLNGMRGKN